MKKNILLSIFSVLVLSSCSKFNTSIYYSLDIKNDNEYHFDVNKEDLIVNKESNYYKQDINNTIASVCTTPSVVSAEYKSIIDDLKYDNASYVLGVVTKTNPISIIDDELNNAYMYLDVSSLSLKDKLSYLQALSTYTLDSYLVYNQDKLDKKEIDNSLYDNFIKNINYDIDLLYEEYDIYLSSIVEPFVNEISSRVLGTKYKAYRGYIYDFILYDDEKYDNGHSVKKESLVNKKILTKIDISNVTYSHIKYGRSGINIYYENYIKTNTKEYLIIGNAFANQILKVYEYSNGILTNSYIPEIKLSDSGFSMSAISDKTSGGKY